MTTSLVRPFTVMSGTQVQRALEWRERPIVELVKAAHRPHAAGEMVHGPSHFLRFPVRPASPVITRPASLAGAFQVGNLKWISIELCGKRGDAIPQASALPIVGDFFHALRRYG